jgi:hypothetical protein
VTNGRLYANKVTTAPSGIRAFEPRAREMLSE